jgi:signal transduction histidine kinase
MFYLSKKVLSTLQARLLLTHLLVMVLSVCSIAAIAHIYKAARLPGELMFLGHDDTPEDANDPDAAKDLQNQHLAVQRVQRIDIEATAIAISLSLLSVGFLSAHISRKIAKPLETLGKAINEFSEGDQSARVPPIPIPELHQLGLKFNTLTASIEGAEKRRRSIFGDVAHELNAPLTIIQLYLQLAQDNSEILTTEAQGEMLAETLRMGRLVRDFLEIATLEQGYLSFDFQAFSSQWVLSGVILSLTAKAAVAGCDLKLIPADVPLIYADCDRFRQILINLINNAITHTQGGTVTVSSHETDQFVWFTVQDTGIGIAPEHLPLIFERFWRADQGRSQTTGGSGIGLSIVKQLVHLQGGTVEVASQLGKGTTFRFSMPLAEYKQSKTNRKQSGFATTAS